MDWGILNEKSEPAEEKMFCEKCGNDSFRVYIKKLLMMQGYIVQNAGTPSFSPYNHKY